MSSQTLFSARRGGRNDTFTETSHAVECNLRLARFLRSEFDSDTAGREGRANTTGGGESCCVRDYRASVVADFASLLERYPLPIEHVSAAAGLALQVVEAPRTRNSEAPETPAATLDALLTSAEKYFALLCMGGAHGGGGGGGVVSGSPHSPLSPHSPTPFSVFRHRCTNSSVTAAATAVGSFNSAALVYRLVHGLPAVEIQEYSQVERAAAAGRSRKRKRAESDTPSPSPTPSPPPAPALRQYHSAFEEEAVASDADASALGDMLLFGAAGAQAGALSAVGAAVPLGMDVKQPQTNSSVAAVPATAPQTNRRRTVMRYGDVSPARAAATATQVATGGLTAHTSELLAPVASPTAAPPSPPPPPPPPPPSSADYRVPNPTAYAQALLQSRRDGVRRAKAAANKAAAVQRRGDAGDDDTSSAAPQPLQPQDITELGKLFPSMLASSENVDSDDCTEENRKGEDTTAHGVMTPVTRAQLLVDYRERVRGKHDVMLALLGKEFARVIAKADKSQQQQQQQSEKAAGKNTGSCPNSPRGSGGGAQTTTTTELLMPASYMLPCGDFMIALERRHPENSSSTTTTATGAVAPLLHSSTLGAASSSAAAPTAPFPSYADDGVPAVAPPAIDHVATLFVERKTLADLDGSIKDGRFYQQRDLQQAMNRSAVFSPSPFAEQENDDAQQAAEDPRRKEPVLPRPFALLWVLEGDTESFSRSVAWAHARHGGGGGGGGGGGAVAAAVQRVYSAVASLLLDEVTSGGGGASAVRAKHHTGAGNAVLLTRTSQETALLLTELTGRLSRNLCVREAPPPNGAVTAARPGAIFAPAVPLLSVLQAATAAIGRRRRRTALARLALCLRGCGPRPALRLRDTYGCLLRLWRTVVREEEEEGAEGSAPVNAVTAVRDGPPSFRRFIQSLTAPQQRVFVILTEFLLAKEY